MRSVLQAEDFFRKFVTCEFQISYYNLLTNKL